jgi:hypothetical protein
LRVETIGAVDKDFSSTLESIAQISLSVEDWISLIYTCIWEEEIDIWLYRE